MRKLDSDDSEGRRGVCMLSTGVLSESHWKESQLLPGRD